MCLLAVSRSPGSGLLLSDFYFRVLTKVYNYINKTMPVLLNLLLFVFSLHVLFIIDFSINLLSQLPRRHLFYNIELHLRAVTYYRNFFIHSTIIKIQLSQVTLIFTSPH